MSAHLSYMYSDIYSRPDIEAVLRRRGCKPNLDLCQISVSQCDAGRSCDYVAAAGR